MKYIKTALLLALASLSCYTASAATGAEAANHVTKDPSTVGYKESDKFLAEFKAYDKNTRETLEYAIWVYESESWDDLWDALKGMSFTVTDAANNSLRALSKIAILEGKQEMLEHSVAALEKSVKEAFESLDGITIKDVETSITRSLSRISTTSTGQTVYETRNFFSGGTADDKSTTKNNSGQISVYGFDAGDAFTIPYKNVHGKIQWENIGLLTDGKSIQKWVDGQSLFENELKLKNWDDPSGTCGEKLSDRLEDGNGTHYILTQKKTDKQLHYMEIGKINACGRPDGVTISTNETGHANHLAIAGAFQQANNGKALICNGEGFTWKEAQTIDVVTGITFSFGDKLEVTVQKKKLKLYAPTEDVQPATTTIFETVNDSHHQ